MKKTVVIGASAKSDRISNQAVVRLKKHHHVAVPIGIKDGEIDGTRILTGKPHIYHVDTVTLYINPVLQKDMYTYILNDLKPKRVIFNPGTENPEFEMMLRANGVETTEACTLVLLSTGAY